MVVQWHPIRNNQLSHPQCQVKTNNSIVRPELPAEAMRNMKEAWGGGKRGFLWSALQQPSAAPNGKLTAILHRATGNMPPFLHIALSQANSKPNFQRSVKKIFHICMAENLCLYENHTQGLRHHSYPWNVLRRQRKRIALNWLSPSPVSSSSISLQTSGLCLHGSCFPHLLYFNECGHWRVLIFLQIHLTVWAAVAL